MSPVDVGILAIVGLSGFFGLVRGAVREIFGLATLVLGLLLAFSFYPDAAERLAPWIHDRLLAEAQGETIPQPIAAEIAPLRLRRKRLASVCLFLVITTILLGLQVFTPFGAWLTILLMFLAALFAWRVYKTPIPYGWV